MPNVVTHNYFAKDVLEKSSSQIRKSFIEKQNIYELFANGFDPFFTSEQLPFHDITGDLGHQNYTDTYFLNYIKIIKEDKLEKNPSILAALYGHLTHYVLDSIMHPYVMYKTGEYEKEKPETLKYKGLHHKMEMQMDAYLYEQREYKPFKNFKIHKLISKEKFDKTLLNTLNKNYEEVFSAKKGGSKYQKSLRLVRNGFKFIVEDRTGMKKFFYRQIDRLTPKKEVVLENLNTYVTAIDPSIFNLEHKIWYNPWDNKIQSNESFFELYDKAIGICLELFEATYNYINNQIPIDDYKKVLKDKSYVTGLSWYIKTEMKYMEF